MGPGGPLVQAQQCRHFAKTVEKAQLELVYDSRAFVQEDQPERFAELVRSFMHTAACEPGTR
jgi:hypothetical protein